MTFVVYEAVFDGAHYVELHIVHTQESIDRLEKITEHESEHGPAGAISLTARGVSLADALGKVVDRMVKHSIGAGG